MSRHIDQLLGRVQPSLLETSPKDPDLVPSATVEPTESSATAMPVSSDWDFSHEVFQSPCYVANSLQAGISKNGSYLTHTVPSSIASLSKPASASLRTTTAPLVLTAASVSRPLVSSASSFKKEDRCALNGGLTASRYAHVAPEIASSSDEKCFTKGGERIPRGAVRDDSKPKGYTFNWRKAENKVELSQLFEVAKSSKAGGLESSRWARPYDKAILVAKKNKSEICNDSNLQTRESSVQSGLSKGLNEPSNASTPSRSSKKTLIVSSENTTYRQAAGDHCDIIIANYEATLRIDKILEGAYAKGLSEAEIEEIIHQHIARPTIPPEQVPQAAGVALKHISIQSIPEQQSLITDGSQLEILPHVVVSAKAMPPLRHIDRFLANPLPASKAVHNQVASSQSASGAQNITSEVKLAQNSLTNVSGKAGQLQNNCLDSKLALLSPEVLPKTCTSDLSEHARTCSQSCVSQNNGTHVAGTSTIIPFRRHIDWLLANPQPALDVCHVSAPLSEDVLPETKLQTVSFPAAVPQMSASSSVMPQISDVLPAPIPATVPFRRHIDMLLADTHPKASSLEKHVATGRVSSFPATKSMVNSISSVQAGAATSGMSLRWCLTNVGSPPPLPTKLSKADKSQATGNCTVRLSERRHIDMLMESSHTTMRPSENPSQAGVFNESTSVHSHVLEIGTSLLTRTEQENLNKASYLLSMSGATVKKGDSPLAMNLPLRHIDRLLAMASRNISITPSTQQIAQIPSNNPNNLILSNDPNQKYNTPGWRSQIRSDLAIAKPLSIATASRQPSEKPTQDHVQRKVHLKPQTPPALSGNKQKGKKSKYPNNLTSYETQTSGEKGQPQQLSVKTSKKQMETSNSFVRKTPNGPIGKLTKQNVEKQYGVTPCESDGRSIVSNTGIEEMPSNMPQGDARGHLYSLPAHLKSGWDGTWGPDSRADSRAWEGRQRFDYGTEDVQGFVKNWAYSLQDQSPVFLNTHDPDFSAGKYACWDTFLDHPMTPYPLCVPNPLSDSGLRQFTYTAETYIQEYVMNLVRKGLFPRSPGTKPRGLPPLTLDPTTWPAPQDAIPDTQVPIDVENAPKIPMYIRPARTKDTVQITEILNHYIKNSDTPEDQDEVAIRDASCIYQNAVESELPLIVAIGTHPPDKRHKKSSENVVGFAYAEDWASGIVRTPTSRSRYTGKVNVYVDPAYSRKYVAFNLMDRLLSFMTMSYTAQECCIWVGHDRFPYRTVAGGRKRFHRIMMEMPYTPKDKNKHNAIVQWLSEKFEFKQVADLEGIGRSRAQNGNDPVWLNVALLQRHADIGEMFDHLP